MTARTPGGPSMRTSLTAAAIVAVLLSTGCGDDAAPDAAADGDAPVGSPVEDPGPAAGACLEGTTDGDDTPGGDVAVPDDGGFDEAAARRDAESLLGEAEDHVLALWGDVRVGRHGEETFALTEDHAPGRKTIATEDDGTGTFRVVEVVLELPVGSVTFR
ncbi:hypothetical protein FTX61_12545 [Nitriliruptoraceae bacterium ZYF776]|nr:hypothetical protein [Profundirhabdus halotolerans]